MPIVHINKGLTPDSPVADTLREGAQKINDNFDYLDGRIDEVVAAIDQDNIDIRKNFRILDGDTPAQMLARINALANYTVTEKQSVWFVGNQMAEPVEIGEIPPLPRTVKFKMMNKGKGTYGTGGTALTLNDLELVYDNGATAGDIETAPSTDVHDFGNIGTLAVEDWLNEQNPAIVIQSQEDGYTLFKGTIDGDAVSYLWLGAAGTYGVGALQATAADFQLLEETVPAVDQNNIGRRIFIGFLDEDSPIGQVVSKLNAITFTIGERESPVLITAFRTVDGIATQKMAFQWMSGKGVFGAGGTGVLLTDIFAHTPEIILPTDVQDDDYTVLIPLNEIAEGGFLAAANAEERDLSDAGLEYFFTYIFDDVTYLVQFIGANHVYGGGGTPLVAEDFTQISDSETPSAVVPNLQQVMEAGDPDTTLPMTFIDDANHSKIRVTGQELDYQQNDINTHIVFESPVNDVALTVPAKAADDTFAMLSDVDALTGGFIPLTGTTSGNPVSGPVSIAPNLPVIWGDIDSGNFAIIGRFGTELTIVNNNGAINLQGNTIGNSSFNFTGVISYDGTNLVIGANPEFTGYPTALTPVVDSNDNKIATTEFVTRAEAATLASANSYADGLVVSVYRAAGNWDASGGTFPTTGTGTAGAIRRGDTFNVSVAGTMGGKSYDVGDAFYANTATPGQTTGNWSRFETNTEQGTSSTRGTVKLYNSTGTNTDGGVDQNTYTNGLAAKVSTTGNETIAGTKTFSNIPVIGTATAGSTDDRGASTQFAATVAASKVQNSLAASTTVAPSATAVNTVLATKLDATAIAEYPETSYSETPTWSGTPPTGITANWRGTKVGKHVSFRINITYSAPGSGITTLQLPFPTGLPTPSAVTGYSTNNDYPISCVGFLNTGTSAQPPAARAFVRKTSTGHIINIVAASGAYSGAIVTVDYWTD